MATSTDDAREYETLSDAIASAIRASIRSHQLEEGTVLRETELARFFKTSREPVSRAVRMLEQEHLISRRSGQGYAVGSGDHAEREFHQDSIALSPDLSAALDGQPAWQSIYGEAETELLPFLPFGRFRIVESAMAERFSVSRSIIQQVIARLCERGIAEKKTRSSSQLVLYDNDFVRECYEVRMELEPAALRLAGPYLAKQYVQQCLASHQELAETGSRLASMQLADLEWELHYSLLEFCPNKRILNALRPSQMPLMITPRMVHKIMGTDQEKPVLAEHISVLQMLCQGADDMAALSLKGHLKESLVRSIDRLPQIHKSQAPKLLSYLKAT